MTLRWRNGILNVGGIFYRGPFVYGVALYWNNREDIEGAIPPLGEVLFMDGIEVFWSCRPRKYCSLPSYYGVYRFKM